MTPFDEVHVYGSKVAEFFRDGIEELDVSREVVVLDGRDEFAEALPEIRALFGLRLPGDGWASAASLEMIQIPGAGVDSLLPARDLADSVLVCNASGGHEPEMPEFVIAMLHALNYRIPTLVDQQRERRWKNVVPIRPLAGGTLCVLGLGAIGQSVARRAAALGMHVVGVRNSGEPVEGVDRVVTTADRLEVITGADALVVVVPLTDETEGLVGEAELAALAEGAVVVDVSRGGVTDTDALVESLSRGHLGAAALDVFETEPLPGDSPLWTTENLLVTPHTAGWSRDYARRIGRLFEQNLRAIENGESPPTLVDRSLGY